ncbi:hypothetical protein M0R72_17805 [Candidatus Pacearchaeota archaeon]|jgi:hypothetical protein|nr:hypothetical protein [Candidatus Pacearchaeota archaeon]
MAAASGFVPASELGPSPSREAELEDLCSRQAEQIERLQDLATEPHPAASQPHGAIIRPEEVEAYTKILGALGKRVEDLERLTAKQAKAIEDLRKKNEGLGIEIYDVREMSRTIIQDACRRITAIEEKDKPENSETNQTRAKKIKEYLAENGTPGKFLDKRTMKLIEGRAVRFELLRSYLVIDKWQLNRALRTLIKMYPGEYCKKKLNKTTWLLVERPKL